MKRVTSVPGSKVGPTRFPGRRRSLSRSLDRLVESAIAKASTNKNVTFPNGRVLLRLILNLSFRRSEVQTRDSESPSEGETGMASISRCDAFTVS